MNKQDIINKVFADKQLGLASRASATRTVDAVLGAIQNGLKEDGVVQMYGFGTFRVRTRAARTGRNPQNGQKIKIKASRRVGFRAGVDMMSKADRFDSRDVTSTHAMAMCGVKMEGDKVLYWVSENTFGLVRGADGWGCVGAALRGRRGRMANLFQKSKHFF